MRCRYELYIYGNTNNIVLFTSFFRKASGPHTIENGVKRYYNSATKTKNK